MHTHTHTHTHTLTNTKKQIYGRDTKHVHSHTWHTCYNMWSCCLYSLSTLFVLTACPCEPLKPDFQDLALFSALLEYICFAATYWCTVCHNIHPARYIFKQASFPTNCGALYVQFQLKALGIYSAMLVHAKIHLYIRLRVAQCDA